jgi:hypothetical protein
MELRVALETWLERIPEFSLPDLSDPSAVTWSTRQIRGPRTLPLRTGHAARGPARRPGKRSVGGDLRSPQVEGKRRPAGRDLPLAAKRPGLAVIDVDGHNTGSVDMRQRSAERAQARTDILDGLGHWWMTQDAARSARTLGAFWAETR